MPSPRTRLPPGSFLGKPQAGPMESELINRSHLPFLFIGMEHLQLSASLLAEEYFRASEAINPSDPLLLNELGVVAYNKEEYVNLTFEDNDRS